MVSQGGWRRALARRLDPAAAALAAAARTPAVTPPPRAGSEDVEVWTAVAAQFAVRTLSTMYQMGSQLATVEADEEDPVRLERLFSLDHAITRARRAAENMLVLTGRGVEDAGRQVTTLLDVVRAGASAIEHYPRVHIGRMADLAVVEFAADDLIRVVTELLDNATRFSPPHSRVQVAAHLTEMGSVLLRVEDDGFGIDEALLDELNAMLVSPMPVPLATGTSSHLGLVVAQRIAQAHSLRVHLTARHPRGSTAAVLIPERLLCEVPAAFVDGRPPLAEPAPSRLPRHEQPATLAPSPAAPSRDPARDPLPRPNAVPPSNAVPPTNAPRAGGIPPGGAVPGLNGVPAETDLPRRVPMSLRGDRAGPPGSASSGSGAPGSGPLPAGRAWPAAPAEGWAPPVTDVDWHPTADDWQPWPDDAADFAAGILDAQHPEAARPAAAREASISETPPAEAPKTTDGAPVPSDIGTRSIDSRPPRDALPQRDTRLPGYPPADEDPSRVTMHLPPVPSQGHEDEH
jgi:hypothetical protein